MSVSVPVFPQRILYAHHVLDHDAVLAVVLGIVESAVEVGDGVDLGDLQLVVAPLQYHGCTRAVRDEDVGIHAEAVPYVVPPGHLDRFVHGGAVIEDVTEQDRVSDRRLSLVPLVHGGFPILDVELQDGCGKSLLVHPVDADVRCKC